MIPAPAPCPTPSQGSAAVTLTPDRLLSLHADGYHGDNARTVAVGKASPASEELALVTKESIEKAIDVVGPGVNYHELAVVIYNRAL